MLRHANGTSSLYHFEDSDSNVSAFRDGTISINGTNEEQSLIDSVHDIGEHRDIISSNNAGHSYSDTGDDSHNDDEEDDVEPGQVFGELRQAYGETLPEKVSGYLRPVSKETSLQDIEEQIKQATQTKHAKVKSCANCCKPRRVDDISWLKEGQHIRFEGQHLNFNFGKQLITLYHHHAIVKHVSKTSGTSVELVLIHFSTVRKRLKINETTETYNLENDEICIIDYMHPRYDPKTIIQRAELMLPSPQNEDEEKQFGSYSLVSCNCEHFASWCVVGEGESFQVKHGLKSFARIFSKFLSSGCKIKRFFQKVLLNGTDEIAVGFIKNIGKHLPVVVLGATASVYLIYTIAWTMKYFDQFKKGKLCKVCFKRRVITLWVHFGAYFTVSGLSYLLVHFVSPILTGAPFGAPLLLVVVLLSVFLQWGIGKVVKSLMSPYACGEIDVTHLSQITPGSMISFNYFLIPHYAIVTGKDVESDKSQKGTIMCVHYGLKGFNVFGIREVIQESFELNVKENIKNVKLIDCRHLNKFQPEDVVRRATARIGETKWRPFANRSDHLCFDTVVQEVSVQENLGKHQNDIAKSKSTHKSSFFVGKKEIHLRSDLQTGHIVEYKGHRGIVVDLKDITGGGEQNFKMDLIIYRYYRPTRKTYTVDLKKERLFIKKYHPSHYCTMGERVQNACDREGEECMFWTTNGFLESCILKK